MVNLTIHSKNNTQISIPSSCFKQSKITSEPTPPSMQGVVVQICTKYFPTGSLKIVLLKVNNSTSAIFQKKSWFAVMQPKLLPVGRKVGIFSNFFVRMAK